MAGEEILSAERQGLALEVIRKRVPNRSEILAVFGIAVFVCFTWTLLHFFNKLSSFLLYFTVGEIGNVFAFMMAFTLLESILITAFLVLLSALLPSGWLRDGFALKGLIILAVGTATSILFQKFLDDYPSTLILVSAVLVPLASIVALIALVQSMPRVRDILLSIQDRILIMSFVYVPVGLISLLSVLYRNLLG